MPRYTPNSNQHEEEEDELGYVYTKNETGLVWKTSILIGSESSMDIFTNMDYFKGIHKAKKPLKLHCNAGHIYIYEKG